MSTILKTPAYCGTVTSYSMETFLRSYPVCNQSEIPAFHGTRKSITHSQVPTTCPYPELNRCSPHTTFHILKIHFNIILPFTPGSSKWFLSLRFPHQNTVYASLSPYVLHAPPISIVSILLPPQYWVRSRDH